jgi:outer membrane receptor protein involved in Fe transport
MQRPRAKRRPDERESLGMNKLSLLGSSALRSALFIGMAAAATPAFAQSGTTPPSTDQTTPTNTPAAQTPVPTDNEVANKSGTNGTTDAQGGANEGQQITVTGSRIRRPNLESTVPITSVSGEEIFQRGQNNIGDVLNELPQLRSTFQQSNAGRFLGTTGLNLLDLRGLGTQRTLVLVNGRRHVPADILNNAVSPDVNTIPNDLVERIDVVTGGNSAIYGSDAIAGVVNFVLKRNFEGLQMRGQAGTTYYGEAGNQYVSALFGHNFAGGRGNITLHGEYAHQQRLYASEVPYLQRVDGFLVVDSDLACNTLTPRSPSTCDPNVNNQNSDGIPDRVFFKDIRSASIYANTMIAFAQRATQPGGPQCGTGFAPVNQVGTPYNCNYLFTPDGQTLVPETGTRVGTGPIGSFIGGNGPTGREGNLLTVFPRQHRYNFNLLAHFTISDAFEPFIEAKAVRVETQGQQSSPAFIQGSSIDASRERIRLDNPFLTPQERAQIGSLITQFGTRPNLQTQTALTATDVANIANGSFRFPIQRYFLDLGVRDEKSRRDTYRVVAGVRGTFNTDWSYELSANYGKVTEDTTILGNIDVARFLFALDSGRDPATGQITCRAKFDPAARVDPFGFGADKLAADIAACTPYDPFGQKGDNAAAKNYIVRDTVSRATLSQFVLNAFVSGNTGKFLNLPGGAISFALGAEYRKEKVFYQADPIVENGYTFYNALPTFRPAPFEVKEAFAEIRIPIVKDIPFFHELTLSGAARVADYKGKAGTVWAYNGGVDWAPIRDLRFRANYSRAVRAPNVSETSFPLTQNFAPGFVDPCSSGSIGSTTNRANNCQTALGPLLSQLPNVTTSLEIRSGSNPLLVSEVSNSLTLGGVFQPHWVPGLSLSVDYYDIKVKNVIGALSAQSIANSCYDQPDLNNQYCALFTRAGAGGGPNGETPGAIINGTLTSIPLNFAALKVRGIDVEAAFRRSLGGGFRFDTRLIYTHTLQNSAFTNPSTPSFENRIKGELGDPEDEFQFIFDVTYKELTVGYRAHYIGKMVLNAWEDFFSLQGRPPQNADYADRMFYPSVIYHDIRFNLEVNRNFNFYVGIDNVTNRIPPLGLTGVGGGSGIYPVRGRNFYGGFRAKFF